VKRLLLAAALLAAASAGDANAFTIRGTVKNGTTGSTNVDASVVVVQPSAGMQQVGAADARNGRFEFRDLAADAPMYLLRTEYAGVTYNTSVAVTGEDQAVEVEVFESTSSWQDVQVIVPHLAARREGDTLHFEQLFEITNDTSPPRSLRVKGGAFRLFLPSDTDSLTDCYVLSGEMPLKSMPIPTDTPDIYSIDYPIRPGVTRVGISYSVPYASGAYAMKAKFPQPVPHMMIFAVDSTMQVTSTTHEFVSRQSVHGMTAYAVHGIAANGELALNFSGGDPNFAGLQVGGGDGRDHGAEPENIRVAAGEEHKISIFLMLMVVFVLTGIVAMALRDRNSPLSDSEVLRAHYALLVARLARLDDLHAAHTIPDDAYRASREELVSRLGALAMHLRSHGGIHGHEKSAHAHPKTSAK
jgi:hypothetical protein